MPRAATVAVLLVFAYAGADTASAASLFDPALRFRTLPTEHFVIYFHQGEDRIAQRLARIAEETWRALQRPFDVAPPQRTQVVLADQTELANGYATPLPYNTIVLYTVAPPGSNFNFDDWLRLVFTHEFTHIVHLDRSEGWARVVRSMFGRTAYAFPNLFLPAWQIEGLATYEESVITGAGRLHAGDFRALVGEAAQQHRLEPLDRVNGGLTDWPGGSAVYAYGAGFHEYLADRFGAETLGTIAKATARRVPYVASPAFSRVYGESLGDLWRDYQAATTASATASPSADPYITRLTFQGFSVSGPRFDRFSCEGCPPDIVYSAVNPQGFPAIYRVGFDGGEPRHMATRYLGSTTAPGRDHIYFDQLEQRRNSGLYSDLYALSRADGRVRQVTSEARLLEPDLSPDGGTLVCVQNHAGQRDLVLVSTAGLKARTTSSVTGPAGRKARTTSTLTGVVQAFRPAGEATGTGPALAITTLIAEPDTQFDAPKWSPDGRTIAVERHRLGAMPEVVTVDVDTKAVRVVAAAPHTRFAMPAWRPDGAALVVAAAPDDQTFNLFEFPMDGSTARQLTHTTGGARWPDVAPDGKTIVFVGYTTDGHDLFSIPYQATTDAVATDDKPAVADVVQSFRPAVADVVQAFRPAVADVVQAFRPAVADVVQAFRPAVADVVQAFRPAVAVTATAPADLKVRTTTGSPVRTTTGSPVRTTTDSQVRTTTGSPVRTTTDSPVRSATDYSPWTTLTPTSWAPIVTTGGDQVRVGAGISGFDVLGYHAYVATATWLVSSPAGATTPRAVEPDWQVSYLYDRWRPTFFISATSETAFFAGSATEAGTPIPTTRRGRQVEGGVIVPIRHVRAQHAARLSVLHAVDDHTLEDASYSRDRTPVRASWQTLTAQTYGYSISREDGVAAGATAELVRRGFGSSADATTATGDIRVYLPGFARHHVVAARFGGGVSIGDATVGRTFLLGGDSPGDGVTDFGSAAFALLRGFSPNTFAGSHVALANAEYRWPIVRPQRGHGTWPLFLHTVHAAVFADAGHAWSRSFDSGAIKSAAGAQLSANVVAGFFAPFTATVGAAWGHDGSGHVSDRVTAYVRIGKAF